MLTTSLRHITAASIAALIAIGACVFGTSYARGVEDAYVNAVGVKRPPIMLNGIALQQAAFTKDDLLPIYGASEVLNEPGPFEAQTFFAHYPTGFAPFAVARGGSRFVVEAEELGALGPSLAGKKVVVSFTPSQLLATSIMSPDSYAGFFSPLHMYGSILNPLLTADTKASLAQDALQQPQTLSHDPFLKFELTELSHPTFLSRLIYYVLWPLAKVKLATLELQDHYHSVAYIRGEKGLTTNLPHVPQTIDWNTDLEKAQLQSMKESTSNPFGFSDTFWKKSAKSITLTLTPGKNAHHIESVDAGISDSPEWSDLILTLEILEEEGAKPILIGRPINADYYTTAGISPQEINDFYTKIEGIADAYHVPLVDFKDLEDDKYFGVDPAPHTSPQGWVYVDYALNSFYHETDY